MQFGIFSVGDVTTDPTTGRTPTEHERIKATVEIARLADEVGLDVFAVGQHHNPPFVASSPTTTLAWIGAQTKNIILSTATTLITTTDPVRLAEDYGTLQHLTDGRMDLMLGRGNTGPVYPWFGKDIRDGIDLSIENYALLRRLWDEEVVTWEGRFRTPLHAFTATPRPLAGVPPFVWHPPTPSAWWSCTGGVSPITGMVPRSRRSLGSAGRCSCAATRRTPSTSSGPTSTTPPSTGAARRWRTSWPRPH